MAKAAVRTVQTITLNFGKRWVGNVVAVVVSPRMAVHRSCGFFSGEDFTETDSFTVTDPVSGLAWVHGFETEKAAIAWAKKAVAALGEDPIADAEVSLHGSKATWIKKPKRFKEIQTWLKSNPPN